MTETERKLRLTRHIREENAMNRVKMKSREEILYGNGKPVTAEELPLVYEGYLNDAVPERTPLSRGYGFRLRLALSVLLFLGVLYLDRSDIALAGKPVGEWVHTQLGVSMEDRLATFADLFVGQEDDAK